MTIKPGKCVLVVAAQIHAENCQRFQAWGLTQTTLINVHAPFRIEAISLYQKYIALELYMSPRSPHNLPPVYYLCFILIGILFLDI